MKILHRGCWFIGHNFLTIRRCEPRFCVATIVYTQTTIWTRLSGMPSKNYDPKLLKGIRKKLGNVLKVDAYDTLMANMLEYVCK